MPKQKRDYNKLLPEVQKLVAKKTSAREIAKLLHIRKKKALELVREVKGQQVVNPSKVTVPKGSHIRKKKRQNRQIELEEHYSRLVDWSKEVKNPSAQIYIFAEYKDTGSRYEKIWDDWQNGYSTVMIPYAVASIDELKTDAKLFKKEDKDKFVGYHIYDLKTKNFITYKRAMSILKKGVVI
ncbi:MAG: hypothetical protein M1477_05735 [Candidatus Thermoplasmatota archaeon]|nr:hypothetical protein [Candidatus Thermoplasmatota archaeon]